MGQEYQEQLDNLLRKIGQLEAVVRSQQQIIVSHQQAIDVQQEKIVLYQQAIEVQQGTIVSQQAAIAVQQERIRQLESALAAAKKNSSNSSKPPSSDIVKPKKPCADHKDNAPNQDGNNQDGSTSHQKQRGGQKGHEAHFRPGFAVYNARRIVFYIHHKSGNRTNQQHRGTGDSVRHD